MLSHINYLLSVSVRPYVFSFIHASLSALILSLALSDFSSIQLPIRSCVAKVLAIESSARQQSLPNRPVVSSYHKVMAPTTLLLQ